MGILARATAPLRTMPAQEPLSPSVPTPATPATPSSSICYFTGGPHRYGESRNLHGPRRCLDCWNAQPDDEAEDEDDDGPQDGQEVRE